MTHKTIFELKQIYTWTNRYPSRKAHDNNYGLFTTLEKAENAMKGIVAEALKEKAEAEKEGEKDYDLATTIGYSIRELTLNEPFIPWNGISIHTYTRMGEPNDDFVYTTPDKPSDLLPFYGVPEEKIKFQIGDIVEVVGYGYASLEIIAALPPSTKEYEICKKRWEQDEPRFKRDTYWDGTDYCYLTYSLGNGDTHRHPDAPSVFAPIKDVPAKLRRKFYAKLMSMHLAYNHRLSIPLMEKIAQEPGINKEILDDLDKVADMGYMDKLHEHVAGDVRILQFTDEQARRLQEIGEKAERNWTERLKQS